MAVLQRGHVGDDKRTVDDVVEAPNASLQERLREAFVTFDNFDNLCSDTSLMTMDLPRKMA